MKKLHHIVYVIVLCLVSFVTAPSQAVIVYDSGGFETPRFMAGLPLEGQDGGKWVRTGTTSASQVQIAVVESGNQAVQITRAPNGDARWGVLTTGFPASPTDLISVKWDMNVLPSGVPSPPSFGPFFGVEAYSDPGGLTFLGSLGVDTATGEILYLDPVDGFTAIPSPTSPFASWHTYELLLDFGADEYSIFYDGALLESDIPFTDGPCE